jgi:ubiquinol-cytochrome c reductase cytochrome c1 subunit
MKRILAAFVIALMGVSSALQANTEEIKLQSFVPNFNDQPSLQRGARTFMNYCSGCHSLQYERYNRMAQDIGITDDNGKVMDELVKTNLMFTADKIQEQIQIAMRSEDAATWFGVPPPDLSLETRARGGDWVYSYLLAFYKDSSRPWGMNNLVFKDVGMPHVLADLQGVQEIDLAPVADESDAFPLKITQPGKLSADEYRQVVYDLTNFLSYVADPIYKTRHYIGSFVILFLVVFLAFSYLLKREYWKDIH